MPIMVFNMDTPGNLMRVLQGEALGTLVHWSGDPYTLAEVVS